MVKLSVALQGLTTTRFLNFEAALDHVNKVASAHGVAFRGGRKCKWYTRFLECICAGSSKQKCSDVLPASQRDRSSVRCDCKAQIKMVACSVDEETATTLQLENATVKDDIDARDARKVKVRVLFLLAASVCVDHSLVHRAFMNCRACDLARVLGLKQLPPNAVSSCHHV